MPAAGASLVAAAPPPHYPRPRRVTLLQPLAGSSCAMLQVVYRAAAALPCTAAAHNHDPNLLAARERELLLEALVVLVLVAHEPHEVAVHAEHHQPGA